MHGVTEVIAILVHARAGLHGKLEGKASLPAFGSRVHAQLHEALAYRGLVAEARQVPDGVEHANASFMPPALPRSGRRYRSDTAHCSPAHTGAGVRASRLPVRLS